MVKKYNITGMSCAACSSRVEKAVSKLEGIESCQVNLLTNSMFVEGTADEESIISAVENAGYGISSSENRDKSKKTKTGENTGDSGIRQLKVRLFSSLVFLIALMYISMGYVMWGFPLPEVLAENTMSIGILQLLLTSAVMVINQRFFINGFRSLFKGSPNMDSLVALGAGAAFGYSVYVLFDMSGELFSGNYTMVAHFVHELYFESAAMILTLITLGKLLEARAKGKTADALKSLMHLAPKTARIIKDGKETVILAEELKAGDIFLVLPGESIPTDGVVVEGVTAVDESAITGESIPVDKKEGDNVTGATINRLGFIKCKTLREAKDNTLSQIIEIVSETAASKAPVSKTADIISGIFVPSVIVVAVVTFLTWLLLGETMGFALARAISVLVISCPCALGLATPVAIMVGSGVGAKNGILFKNATSLEVTGKTQIIALDKTGTVTRGEPEVTEIITADDVSERELICLAVSLEKKSEHPIAKAIVKKGEVLSADAFETEKFEVLTGSGVYGEIDKKPCFAGNYDLVKNKTQIPQKFIEDAERISENGNTPLFFCQDGKFFGIIAVADAIKCDSREAIAELKDMGIRVVMVTGDNEKTAKAVAKQVGIDKVIAGVLPKGKCDAVSGLKKSGKVAMVGDGINDAPALSAADIGIAVGTGTDVAIDAADVVLMKSGLKDIGAAIRLSKRTLRNIYENLFWAFIYNVIGIPLAAGVFIHFTGWQLSPMFGAAAMSLSSFCVVSNALRLNFVNVYNKREKVKERKMKMLRKTIKIEGMMCPHCEASVKTALESLGGAKSVEVSHKEGTAVVEFDREISDEILLRTVEEKGYKVLGIE